MSKENIDCLDAWVKERENRTKPPNKYQRKALKKRNLLIEQILKKQQQNEKH